jgi:hypothetical protein
MSSYSEYLGRMKQRLPKVLDTRPHRDAGHQTEVVKRLAASAVLETLTPATSGNLVLDGPSTRVISLVKPSHRVQDTTDYNAYTAGQAVAQSSTPANTKAPQISQTCYSSTVVPEYNDRLAADEQLAAVQASKNQFQRGWNTASCCVVCGKPPNFGRAGCSCVLTADQQVALPTSGSRPTVPS